jgi:DNA (cytosine-5)-methyltransferase 1
MSQQECIVSVLKRAKSSFQPYLLNLEEPVVQLPSFEPLPFRFIDIFAGIGGFRIALEQAGGSCVFTSEWDKNSQKTYHAWHGDAPHGDIQQIAPTDIPDHDVLAAGFPCQPFSIAGVSKKNSLGREHGFKDATQGTLFFNLVSIMEVKRPQVAILENVKNLKSHDKGRTWRVIQETLDALDYWVFHKVIDAAGWVPQHRERIYIVAFDKKTFRDRPPFEFPQPPDRERPRLESILDENPDSKYTLTDHLWRYLQDYAARHKAKGNGFGYGLADPGGITRTLSARYYKDGSEILIAQDGKNPRRLTPRECARLMGFDDRLPIVVSDVQAYRQFGNAVVPAVVEAIGREVVRVLMWQSSTVENDLLQKSS